MCGNGRPTTSRPIRDLKSIRIANTPSPGSAPTKRCAAGPGRRSRGCSAIPGGTSTRRIAATFGRDSAPAEVHTGNRTTADRWAGLLGELGNEVGVQQDWNGEECDLLIALHARRSWPSVQRFREAHPRSPLILALTGTDVYGDLEKDSEAKRSLELATRVVVLQDLAAEALPQ